MPFVVYSSTTWNVKHRIRHSNEKKILQILMQTSTLHFLPSFGLPFKFLLSISMLLSFFFSSHYVAMHCISYIVMDEWIVSGRGRGRGRGCKFHEKYKNHFENEKILLSLSWCLTHQIDFPLAQAQAQARTKCVVRRGFVNNLRTIRDQVEIFFFQRWFVHPPQRIIYGIWTQNFISTLSCV